MNGFPGKKLNQIMTGIAKSLRHEYYERRIRDAKFVDAEY